MSDQKQKAGSKPAVPYAHLYVDDAGISHLTSCALEKFELHGVGPADPQWNDKMQRSEATVVFTVQPVGWVGDWHENPAPQWIVVLSGRWWIESMDGTRIEQGRGNSPSERIRDARRRTAGRATSRARSATNPAA